jgi:tetratricopeptide (TPR) repeat protein
MRPRTASLAVGCVSLALGCASTAGRPPVHASAPTRSEPAAHAPTTTHAAAVPATSECARAVTEGLRAHEQGHSEQAERLFSEAVRRDPTCAAAYVDLAILQRARGERAEARRNLRRALAIDARLLPAFNELALLYLADAEGDSELDLAEVVCTQAQQIDGKFAPLYNTWGLIDLRRNRITEAAAKFRRAFELDPTLFVAYLNFGRIALSFRGYADARAAFERALALRPRSFDALIGLGVALRGQAELAAAEARYAEALALDPTRPEPDYNLGVLYQDFRSGSAADMQRAREHFQRFLGKAHGRPEYAAAVDEVTRRCAPAEAARPRRRDRCSVGRLQTIEQYLEAL